MHSWLVEGKRPLLRKEGLTNNSKNNGMVGHGDQKIQRVAGSATGAMCDEWMRAEASELLVTHFEI